MTSLTFPLDPTLKRLTRQFGQTCAWGKRRECLCFATMFFKCAGCRNSCECYTPRVQRANGMRFLKTSAHGFWRCLFHTHAVLISLEPMHPEGSCVCARSGHLYQECHQRRCNVLFARQFGNTEKPCVQHLLATIFPRRHLKPTQDNTGRTEAAIPRLSPRGFSISRELRYDTACG